jgi:predicted transcriptional regulator
MLVTEIMISTNIQMRPHDSIRNALELFKSSKLNGVPVVDESGKLIGFFSRTNLIDCLLNDISLDTAIDKYYIRDVVYLREDKSYDTLEELTHWLQTCKVGQTIVVNMKNEPIGVLTQAATVIDLLDRTEYLYKELSSVIENVPAGILATNDAGYVTLANQYAKDILQEVQVGKYIGEYL